jgi:hypothetical protein
VRVICRVACRLRLRICELPPPGSAKRDYLLCVPSPSLLLTQSTRLRIAAGGWVRRDFASDTQCARVIENRMHTVPITKSSQGVAGLLRMCSVQREAVSRRSLEVCICSPARPASERAPLSIYPRARHAALPPRARIRLCLLNKFDANLICRVKYTQRWRWLRRLSDRDVSK